MLSTNFIRSKKNQYEVNKIKVQYSYFISYICAYFYFKLTLKYIHLKFQQKITTKKSLDGFLPLVYGVKVLFYFSSLFFYNYYFPE